MATQKKTPKKTTTPKKTVKVTVPETTSVVTPVCQTKKVSDILTRTVLVFETAVLYFIILFIVFVANNFTILFYPK